MVREARRGDLSLPRRGGRGSRPEGCDTHPIKGSRVEAADGALVLPEHGLDRIPRLTVKAGLHEERGLSDRIILPSDPESIGRPGHKFGPAGGREYPGTRGHGGEPPSTRPDSVLCPDLEFVCSFRGESFERHRRHGDSNDTGRNPLLIALCIPVSEAIRRCPGSRRPGNLNLGEGHDRDIERQRPPRRSTRRNISRLRGRLFPVASLQLVAVIFVDDKDVRVSSTIQLIHTETAIETVPPPPPVQSVIAAVPMKEITIASTG